MKAVQARVEALWRQWWALRFRDRVKTGGGALVAVTGAVTFGLAVGPGPVWAIGWLILVSVLCEVGAIVLVIAELRIREDRIREHVGGWRTSMRGPTVTTSPIHNTIGVGPGRYTSGVFDETARKLHELDNRTRQIEYHVTQRIAPQVNEAVHIVRQTATRGDERLEAFVVRVLEGERGWSKLGVLLLVVGLIVGAANIWSLSL